MHCVAASLDFIVFSTYENSQICRKLKKSAEQPISFFIYFSFVLLGITYPTIKKKSKVKNKTGAGILSESLYTGITGSS